MAIALVSLGLSAAWVFVQQAPADAWSAQVLGRVDWRSFILMPAAALAVEACCVGWRRSSLRHLLNDSSPSTRVDWQYTLFGLMGGTEAFMRLSACGLLEWAEGLSGDDIGVLPLRDLDGWLRYPLLFLAGNFLGYWQHRALHSRWLWPLHKIHHSPTEFTIANIFRVHPAEFALQALAIVLGLSVLGFSPADVAVYSIVAAWFTTYTHSRCVGTWRLEGLGIMTAAGHRLHHGIAVAHQDRNFGDMINLWDRLFGTYTAPGRDTAEIRLGVADVGDRDVGYPPAELLRQTADCLRAVLTGMRGLARRGGSAGQET